MKRFFCLEFGVWCLGFGVLGVGGLVFGVFGVGVMSFFSVHDKNISISLTENWFCPYTLKGAQFSSISPFRAGVKIEENTICDFCHVLNAMNLSKKIKGK